MHKTHRTAARRAAQKTARRAAATDSWQRQQVRHDHKQRCERALLERAHLLLRAANLGNDGPYNVGASYDPGLLEKSKWQISYDRDNESLTACGATFDEALARFAAELRGDSRAARDAASINP